VPLEARKPEVGGSGAAFWPRSQTVCQQLEHQPLTRRGENLTHYESRALTFSPLKKKYKHRKKGGKPMHLTFTPEQQLLHKLKNVASRPKAKANTNKRAITTVTGATCI